MEKRSPEFLSYGLTNPCGVRLRRNVRSKKK